MECSVCKTRSSIGYCPDCQKLLCEVCGVPCSQCGVMLCEEHRVQVDKDTYLCKRCAQKADAGMQHHTPPPRHHHRHEPPKQKFSGDAEESTAAEEPKGFSFQDLMEDLEDEGFEYKTREPVEPESRERDPQGKAAASTATADVGDFDKPLVSDDPNEFVILTGSASKRMALWAKTYWITVAAFVVILFLWAFPGLGYVQPHTSYFAMLITFSGFFWGCYGVYKDYDEEVRNYYFPPMAVNLLLTLWAYSLID